MAVPTRDSIAVESTLVGEDIRMELSADAADQVHLVSVLTDIYEDQILAVEREYATNARDAHIEAGFSGPVEVRLPSALSPSFHVRDYGEGLDLDEIRTLYSKYGKSTKRTTNDATGMLGIGCKSALTYADQFTVVSIKDGEKTVVSVSRDEDGGGTMKVLSREATDEASGVEIIVPVARGDHAAFEEAADHLFRFWPDGSVLVDGQAPTHVSEDAYEVKPGELYVIEEENADNDWVVMGNVPYPADLDLYKKDSYGSSKVVVAFVEIGAVHFTPSREALQQTTRTKRRLEQIKADFSKAAGAVVEKVVATADTKHEAFQRYWQGVKALDLPGRLDVKYRGEAVPDRIAYDDAPDQPATYSRRRWHRSYRRNSDDIKPHEFRLLPVEKSTYGRFNDNTVKSALGVDDFDHPLIFVTNFFPTTFSKEQRVRLDAYREQAGKSDHRMILVKRKHVPMQDWMGDAVIWDWADVRKWRDPNAPKAAGGGAKKVSGSYDVRSKDEKWGVETPADKLPKKANLYWIQGRKYDGLAEVEFVSAHNPRAQLVVLPANRVEKFKRDFPHAVHIDEVREALAAAAWDALSDREKVLAWWNDAPSHDVLNRIDPDAVRDPELAETLRAMRDREKIDRENLPSQVVGNYVMPTLQIKLMSDAELTHRYPLLKHIRSYDAPRLDAREHLILYFNAVYTEKEESA